MVTNTAVILRSRDPSSVAALRFESLVVLVVAGNVLANCAVVVRTELRGGLGVRVKVAIRVRVRVRVSTPIAHRILVFGTHSCLHTSQ